MAVLPAWPVLVSGLQYSVPLGGLAECRHVYRYWRRLAAEPGGDGFHSETKLESGGNKFRLSAVCYGPHRPADLIIPFGGGASSPVFTPAQPLANQW